MPVRDDVIFGPGITFGEARQLDLREQTDALKSRLDTFLIEQVDELGWDDQGNATVYAPFPLFLLTFVAMETLGKALFRKNMASDADAQKEGFLEVAKRIDGGLSKPLSKAEKKDYNLLWGVDEHKKLSSKAEILYKIGRHTMAHGYRGKGVYITAEDQIGVWRMNLGAIELNPYRFWKEFKRVYDQSWAELTKEKENTAPRTRSASRFLQELLND